MKIQSVRDFREDHVKTRTWSDHDAERKARIDKYHLEAMSKMGVKCDCEICRKASR